MRAFKIDPVDELVVELPFTSIDDLLAAYPVVVTHLSAFMQEYAVAVVPINTSTYAWFLPEWFPGSIFVGTAYLIPIEGSCTDEMTVDEVYREIEFA